MKMDNQESKDNSVRISRARLMEISGRLGEKDKSILVSFFTCRFLTTKQIKRLHFKGASSPSAAMRSANRTAKKLESLGLITALERRIGGVRAGSGSYVWTLTMAGVKLLGINNLAPQNTGRKQPYEPTSRFLLHTLAIAEVYIQLTEICEAHHMELSKVEFEPLCWRTYPGPGGVAAVLKPDLYVVLTSGDYEDHYFFEIDMETEAPSRIVRKCWQYVSYYKSGAQQRQAKVFPLVVWLSCGDKRGDSLRCHIQSELGNFNNIFLSTTPDKLEGLVRGGPQVTGTDIPGGEPNG